MISLALPEPAAYCCLKAAGRSCWCLVAVSFVCLVLPIVSSCLDTVGNTLHCFPIEKVPWQFQGGDVPDLTAGLASKICSTVQKTRMYCIELQLIVCFKLAVLEITAPRPTYWRTETVRFVYWTLVSNAAHDGKQFIFNGQLPSLAGYTPILQWDRNDHNPGSVLFLFNQEPSQTLLNESNYNLHPTHLQKNSCILHLPDIRIIGNKPATGTQSQLAEYHPLK